jgi:DNA-binding transcriptional ArsR family regulator
MNDELSAVFAALADPTRRAILRRLMAGEAAVVELARPIDLSARAVAKHIAVLEAAGLVTRHRESRRNMTRVRLEPLQEIDIWLQDYRASWNQRLGKLGEHLARRRKRK